ncbi:PepSY domain-containing protein [Flavobacterium amniphilum]|uniref:PepSY domain-containing protein n=1 Tax=Flavobacterium amniphilum TaxID=1834035 RepID=UPI002029C711|nr:PepSY domain-containing protein [Flavobacterium amniphilum]MCL9807347.1 PepSY domain-containing protein [Flavobacterium amniphilum]
MEKNLKKKSFGKKLKKKLKQRIYKWHKTLALITMIPMIFWCLSGIMHPFMAHFFKPQIANETLKGQKFDSLEIQTGIQEALLVNHITDVKNFRLVVFNDNQYYQVKTIADSILYINTFNGKLLPEGDKQYGEWLARYFLDDQKSKMTGHELITQFNSQYKYVNRYLPVHKVSFERDDEMEVYVETTSDKLATFNPKSRQWFIWFFDVFHNWSFLDAIANNPVRIFIMILLLTVIGLSALTGLVIYGLFWKQFKKVKAEDATSKWRKYHRQTGLALALFTVLFAFSGGYHATKKWSPIAFEEMMYESEFKVSDFDSDEVTRFMAQDSFKNISMVKFKEAVYYRSQLANGKNDKILYVNAKTKKVNAYTDAEYAKYLANYFNAKVAGKGATCCEMDSAPEEKCCEKKIKETAVITDFKNREYGFVNKRLPVVKVAYESCDDKTLFIETATSRLAAYVTNSDRVEGYSFAIFHKFLFMEWAGKDIRDLTMVLAALGVLVVGILGIRMLFKK